MLAADYLAPEDFREWRLAARAGLWPGDGSLVRPRRRSSGCTIEIVRRADRTCAWKAAQYRGRRHARRSHDARPCRCCVKATLVGVIAMWRSAERGRSAPKQIELVTTFADQAVIAIENVNGLSTDEGSARAADRNGGDPRVISGR